jgi:penicillin-binding protein 1A
VLWRRRSKPPKRRRLRKLRFLALFTILCLVSLVSFAYGLISAIASELPSLEPRVEGKRVQELGYVYASDGKTVLSVLRGDENRIVVDSKAIAPVMKQAIVAVEDRRFWEHRGVDFRGVVRAIWADVRNKEIVQGGSTITQQFVKNTYTEKERTVSRKLKEAALAWQLENRWSKDRILTAYLNTIYFGNGAYGVEMAARVYFDKRARDLTLPEAGLLAGLAASPGRYDPASNAPRAELRRRTVLRMMLSQGLITRGDFFAADEAPMPDPEKIGLPGVKGREPYFAEYVKQQLVPYYGSGRVFGGGLRITTSIDLRLQRLGRAAIDKWLAGRGPSAALVAIDPRDGRVLAMVGGRNFKKSQFNLAVQGERQSGSAFKPFVLATAISQGISPQNVFESEPTVINLGDKLWSVSNYEGSYLGSIDLFDATTHSDNAVYAQLTALVGPRNVARIAHRLGVRSALDEYFAIGLGVEAVNPLEMARAFATLANGGERIDGALLGNSPRAVLSVQDGDRRDLNAALERPVIDSNHAAVVTDMLENVLISGTGRRAALDDRPAAGKTGTTENYGDAWFVGYTPQLAVAVWVGYPNKLIPMEREYFGQPVAGGTFPAQIWKTFTEQALDVLNEPPEYFPAPAYDYSAPYEVTHRNNQWLLDNGNCRDTQNILFVTGAAPTREAPCKPNEVDVPQVIGTPIKQARDRLIGIPLTPELITRPAKPGEEVGKVVDQFPKSGKTASSWDEVRIVVPVATNGTIPNVVGLTFQEARARLARRRLAAFVDAFVDGDDGIVLGQRPRAGLAAGPNMTIRLLVGRSSGALASN